MLVLVLQENLCMNQSAQAPLPNPQNLCQSIEQACSMLAPPPIICLPLYMTKGLPPGCHVQLLDFETTDAVCDQPPFAPIRTSVLLLIVY